MYVCEQVLSLEDDEDVEAVQKMKTLYQSCLDTDTIDSLGAEPLIDLIHNTGSKVLLHTHHFNYTVYSHH